ncbi:hypothetical protein S40293_10483 [Stachybotrys chartarum IBT 40293]|nr:hypothetical protein S40293_10483 [Stachybotrys chartarum IBT 40293]KFA70759.1 hypothetical protein S40288_11487 [Stachybotrys chartarum IBT 40288]
MQFSSDLDELWSDFDHPDPNDISEISFCEYAELMFDIPAVVAHGTDTTQSFTARLDPIHHIAVQCFTQQWKTDKYVTLEGLMYNPHQHARYGQRLEQQQHRQHQRGCYCSPALACGRAIHVQVVEPSSRLVLEQRLEYHGYHIRAKSTAGDVLDLLDTQVLPNNPPQGVTD